MKYVTVSAVIAWALLNPALAADSISVGALRFTSHAPTFIGLERGYFAEQGLEVELEFFQAAQPIAVAIASGDIDFGITALTGGFYNLADKGALKVIGGLFAEHPGYHGSAILASNQAYAAGLTSPAALKGKSFAMTQQGSSFHYIAGMIAAKHGFELADLSLRPLQKVGAMIGALKSGQVDAMAIVPHIATALDRSGAAKIIGWVRDLGDYQVTTIFTSTANVQNRPEQVERFMRAYVKAIADYRAALLDQNADPADRDAVIDIIHRYVYADQPRAEAAPLIQAGAVYMGEGAALNLDDIAKQLAWFQAQGFAPAGLALDDFVDSRFVGGAQQ